MIAPDRFAVSACRSRLVCGFLVMLGALVVTAGAARGAGQVKPSCALIDVHKSPLAALVEAKLLDDSRRTWVERSEIDKVLAEQQLQAAFGADAGPSRAALGKVLKADVLVFLRTGAKENRPYAEVVVAETSGGLRLLVRRVPLSNDAEANSEEIVKLLDQALQKHGETIREIYAVPPFVSQDLTYEHGHLKTAYAKLMQETLLGQPGILVVELAEAEALAREYELAAPGERPNRRLPVYLLGEYRHQGRGEELQVTVKVQWKRGTGQLDELQKTLAPAAVPGFLKEVAGRAVSGDAASTPATGAALEARQLAQQAGGFMKLGDWPEALTLYEASLLLQPEVTEVREAAIEVLCLLSKQWPETRGRWQEILQYRRRRLQHLEALLRLGGDEHELCSAIVEVRRGYDHVRWAEIKDEDLQGQTEQLRRDEHDFLRLLAERLGEAGRWRESRFALEETLQTLEPNEQYAERKRMILKHQDQPSAEPMARMFAYGGHKVDFLDTPDGRRFLNELRSLPQANATIREVAGKMLAELDAADKPKARGVVIEVPPTAEPCLELRPLDIDCMFAYGRRGKLTLGNGAGWLPLDNGIDVGWSYSANIYKLARKDRAKQIWLSRVRNSRLSSLTYCGRYLWVTVNSHKDAPQLVVIDPVSEKSWSIGSEHGLPLVSPADIPGTETESPSVTATAVEPGRAIVAGYFGRTFIANVVFDPGGKHQVEIFHEAREVYKKGDREAWKNLATRFRPGYMHTLTGPPDDSGARQQRVLIGGAQGTPFYAHPLIVDPQTLSVEVMSESWPMRQGACLAQGAMYYSGSVPPHHFVCLLRMGLPDLKPKVVVDRIHEGHIAFCGDTVHAVGKRWWRGKLSDKRFTYAGEVPWIYSNRLSASPREETHIIQPGDCRLAFVAPSNHFGVIVGYYSEGRGGSGRGFLAQAVFDASGDATSALAADGEVRQGEGAEPALTANGQSSQQSVAQENSDTAEADARTEQPQPVGAPLRTWTDSTGKFSTEATFLGLAAGKVRLQKADGKVVEVPLVRLSAADQQFLGGHVPTVYVDRCVDWHVDPLDEFRGLLARELIRQAFVIAAGRQLGLRVRDACLGDAVPAEGENAPFDLTLEDDGPDGPRVRLRRGFANAQTAVLDLTPKFDLAGDGADAYLHLLEQMERYSRTEFAAALERSGFQGEPHGKAVSAEVAPEIQRLLGQMTLLAQFQAIRQLHAAIRTGGESPQLLGALVRAYSNMGMMSGYLWSPAHKVFKARALLYAQRLIATDPQRPGWGRWHRGYALAMAGLHALALQDLQTPPGSPDPPKPGWVARIDAYCRYDVPGLMPSRADVQDKQLTRLLAYLVLESVGFQYTSPQRESQILKVLPECFRVRQGFHEYTRQWTKRSMAIDDAATALRANLYRRLAAMPHLPPDVRRVAETANQTRFALEEEQELQIRAQTIAALEADAANEGDLGELSWASLGALIREVSLVHAFYYTQSPKEHRMVPIDDRLKPMLPFLNCHRYAPLLKTFLADAALKDEGIAALKTLQPNGYSIQAYPIYHYMRKRQPESTEAFRLAFSGNADWVADDLIWRTRIVQASSTAIAQLEEVSPHSLYVKYYLIVRDWNQAQDKLDEWEPQIRHSFELLMRLGVKCLELERYADAERFFRQATRVTPVSLGYRLLARACVYQGKKEQWQAALDELFRTLPDEGYVLDMVRHDVATDLMERGRWEDAKPLMLAAAEAGIPPAIPHGAECCEAVHDWSQTERLYREMAARQEECVMYWYFFCKRTGEGDFAAAKQAAENYIRGLPEEKQKRSAWVAFFFEMEGQPEKALEIHKALFAKSGDPINGIWLALLADQLQDSQTRDAALQGVKSARNVRRPGEPQTPLVNLAKQIINDFAGDGKGELDLKTIEFWGAAPDPVPIPPGHRMTLDYCLGKYFSLRGKTDLAIKYWKQCMADTNSLKPDRTRAGYELLKLGVTPAQYKDLLIPRRFG